jgi:hypothetical protein
MYTPTKESAMAEFKLPEISGSSRAATVSWFKELSSLGLIFHPDDDPEQIFNIESGKRMFSAQQASQLSTTLSRLFKALGDDIYDIAFETVSSGFHSSRESDQQKRSHG